MIIMKFGGSSTENLVAINRVVGIVKESINDKPLLVFSAMGKTTRKLLNAAKFVENGNAGEALSILTELKREHRKVMNLLTEKNPSKRATERLEGCFNELDNLFKGLSVLKDLSPKSLDKILSFGEIMATIIMEQALTAAGVKAIYVDSREIMITDNHFGAATPLLSETENAIAEKLMPLIEEGYTPVLQGFIGSTILGHTTTLGFEGSDYTAAIFGNLLKVKRIELWKTVPGLMTADPTKLSTATPIEYISYHEAATLTNLGASCIHAKAIAPAQILSIPIMMKNSSNPADKGTVISFDTLGNGTARSITDKSNLTMIWIRRGMSTNLSQMTHAILSLIGKSGITPSYFSMVESGFVILLPTENADPLVHDLESISGITWNQKNHLSLVSIVGEGLTKSKRFYLPLMKALESTNVHHIIEDTTFRSFGVLIDQSELESTLKNLHRVIFEKRKDINL